VEIRVADACPIVDDAVLIAGLARALVDTAVREDEAGLPLPESPQVLLRAATWRAARSGLIGHLVDPITRNAVPAHDRVKALLRHTRTALEDRGDWETVVELCTALRARGTSTDRQRGHLQKGLGHQDLVAALIAETQQA
jgi:carboxylate-amine ligase